MTEQTRIKAKMRFKPRSDTLENWTSKDPVLLAGEPGVVIDGTETEKIKFGDGVTHWNELGWWKGPKGDKGDTGEKGTQGEQGLQGPKGDKGETGERGPKGEKGDTGPQGIQGDKGDKGESYILTDNDINEIANIVLSNFEDVAEVGR